ncbi:MAG: PilZ domain-containing protein [Desulfobacteraceae bacterium]|nr:PilZ domain-containing protein [Desulfobacteraceae bacterium]
MLQQASQRAYPRIIFKAPIQCGVVNGESNSQFHNARTLNYSAGGFCYETDQQLMPEAEVCIVMDNYTPGQTGPECYRSYLTRVCWIQPLSSRRKERFAAGAQIIARSHEVLDVQSQKARHNCDLCSALTSTVLLHSTEANALLCEQCFKHFQSLPKGKIRECLERFLMGNVV